MNRRRFFKALVAFAFLPLAKSESSEYSGTITLAPGKYLVSKPLVFRNGKLASMEGVRMTVDPEWKGAGITWEK